MSNSHKPPFIPLPVPPEYSVQWPPPSKQISKPSPLPGLAPVPVPKHPIDTPPGDPTIGSQSLPVPLECTEQCQAPSILDRKQSPNPIPVPDPALVPVPEHTPDLPSRDPNQDPPLLSSWLRYQCL
ncbi:zyxin-like [Macrobrachium rosenbergii]|uniref:zyxin-like n=1 Tax=Macrobrachium rosenbergii TaxID=79674 RepID=UPI0034D74324